MVIGSCESGSFALALKTWPLRRLVGSAEGFAREESDFAVVLAFEDAGFEPALGTFSGENAHRFSHFNQQQVIVGDHHGDADIVAEGDEALPFVAGISIHRCDDARDAVFRKN
jgi:hypothetical protein